MTKVTEPPPGAVDLGHGTYYTRAVSTAGEWVGIHEWHHDKDGDWCAGYVAFETADQHPDATRWHVESRDPLTLSPSLLCTACQHHGWIRNGRWEPA